MTDNPKDDEPKPESSNASKSARMRAAEARRQRILKASAKRMDVVSGEFSSTRKKPEEEEQQEQQQEKENEPQAQDATATATETVAAPPLEEEPSSVPRKSSSSRLAQMRRRRFKQDQQKKQEQQEENGETSKEAETTPSTEVKETESITKEKSSDVEVKGETVEVKEEQPESTEEQQQQQPGEEEKKQYMGVAKMRRKMIAEKKKKEAEDPSAGKEKIVIPRSLSMAITEIRNPVPIYLQLISIILLFLVGLDVGFQQRDAIMMESIVYGFGFKESRLLSPLLQKEAAQVQQDGSIFGDDDVASLNEPQSYDDEFAVSGEEDTIKEPNIDPIFRVDLDELTKGDDIIMTFARFAIRCHRFIIFLFLVFPMSVLQKILSFPASLMNIQCTPVFFVIAFVVRRVAKLLGAEIPTVEEEMDESKGGKDILAMVFKGLKGMVTSFLPGFGVIAGLYGLLKDAKDDLMIMLCGLMIGLSVPLQLPQFGADVVDVESSPLTGEEL